MSIDWTKPLVVAGTDRVATVSETHPFRGYYYVEADWDGDEIVSGQWVQRDTTAVTNAPPTPKLGPEHIEALAEAIGEAESSAADRLREAAIAENKAAGIENSYNHFAKVSAQWAESARPYQQRAARLAEMRAYLESLH